MYGRDKYDVIIVGGGIAGLVCGNYLAKAGKKVLISEAHSIPGGCAGSFSRGGFNFDIGVHFLSGFGKNARLRKLFDDLGLDEKVGIRRVDPSDLIIMPDLEVPFGGDLSQTIATLKENFPGSVLHIERFFEFIFGKNFFAIYGKLKDITFARLLDEYFEEDKLKAVLSIPLANIGLPASLAPAVTSVVLYRQFLADGGYYPSGGMQRFVDALVETFEEQGGEMALSAPVRRIWVDKQKKIKGVLLEKGTEVKGRLVVAACDASSVFLEMLDTEIVPESLVERLSGMRRSISAFVVYLGVDRSYREHFKYDSNIWHFSTYDIEREYYKVIDQVPDLSPKYSIITFPSFYEPRLAPGPDHEVISIYIGAPYISRNYWEQNKSRCAENIIDYAGSVLPGLRDALVVQDAASPATFERYTRNSCGAIYGIASTSAQIDRKFMSQDTPVEGLYLAGHWSTMGLGQGGVISCVYSGQRTAKMIIEQED